MGGRENGKEIVLNLFETRFIGFPRRSFHVLLPERPAAAARAGLALYDSTQPHQRAALALGTALLDLRLLRVLRLRPLPPALFDQHWWNSWCEQIAVPVVGTIACAAFRLWEDRIVALLMTASGRPCGFVKVWQDPPGPPRPDPYMQPTVLRHLSLNPPSSFRVAALLLEGTLDGWLYQLFEPLPVGPHRPVVGGARRIARIFDEMRERLDDLPRSPQTPPHHVLGHGDFTPRNVRRASDGRIWILDWEYANWSPPLTDELQFWTARSSLRTIPRPRRDGRNIVALLRERGSDTDILEALRWGAFMTPEQSRIADVVAREMRSEEP